MLPTWCCGYGVPSHRNTRLQKRVATLLSLWASGNEEKPPALISNLDAPLIRQQSAYDFHLLFKKCPEHVFPHRFPLIPGHRRRSRHLLATNQFGAAQQQLAQQLGRGINAGRYGPGTRR